MSGRNRAQKRVLVVDDSTLMRRLITEIVEADPDLCVVDVAENGKVALQKVKQHQPDCVLLDVEMPELSGLDTMRRLRLRSPAKVVILSHLGQEGSRVRAEALRLGAVDVIDKPTGSVSRDLRSTRGAVIQQTLRRVLGLPLAQVPDEPLPVEGAAAMASLVAVHVRGLGALAERAQVTEVVDLVNGNLALVEEITRKRGGSIDAEVAGQALAVFGVPRRQADHAARAVAAAREIADAVAASAAARKGAGAHFVEAGLVVVTGLVVAAELGSPGARRYRTMGDAVDVALRLGRAVEPYGADVVASGSALSALQAPPRTRRLDVVQLDLEGEPIALHEVLSPRAAIDQAALEAYAAGLDHYEAGRFSRAAKAFDEVVRVSPADRAASLLLARCRALLRAPPVAWRGVWPLYGAVG